jgi:DNA-binding transcriptional regulator YiaG
MQTNKQSMNLNKNTKPVPYTMRLPDGRTVYVEIPVNWTKPDRSGQIAFTPKAVRFLDEIRALAMPLDQRPSPGFLAALRQAMGFTQQQWALKIGVNAMTVSRWERGELHPGSPSLRTIERLRRTAVRRGVVIAA